MSKIEPFVLDGYSTVETPEGVELKLRAAGPVARALAWTIDLLIRGVLYLFLGVLPAVLGKAGLGLWLISIFLGEWFYPALFEVYADGRTPGKRALGIRAVKDDGTPIDWPTAMIRNLLRAVDFLPFLYGFGLCAMLLRQDFKRLGDLAAGSRVIYADEGPTLPVVPRAPGRAPLQPLELDEQWAVTEFAARSEKLSAERAEELADLARSVTGCTGAAGVSRLIEMANWLLGYR
ncbi:MAG: RDD family protein [Betaproteobacteria bacterium]|nr:RDD family protein [Betaproteobacteria bacterium]